MMGAVYGYLHEWGTVCCLDVPGVLCIKLWSGIYMLVAWRVEGVRGGIWCGNGNTRYWKSDCRCWCVLNLKGCSVGLGRICSIFPGCVDICLFLCSFNNFHCFFYCAKWVCTVWCMLRVFRVILIVLYSSNMFFESCLVCMVSLVYVLHRVCFTF